MKIIISSVVFLLIHFALFAGELNIQPAKPKINEQLRLTYFIDKNEPKPDSVLAMIFVFSEENSFPKGYETFLRYDKQSGFYLGNIILSDAAVYGIAKVRINSNIDDNFGNYWDFSIYLDSVKKRKFADFRAALSLMGNMPEDCDRNVDYSKALEFLEAETKNYQGNIQAEIGLVSLKYDLKKISEEDFLSQLQKIIDKYDKLDNESETLAYTRALKTLNHTDKAERIEYRVINQFPSGKLAEEFTMSELSKARSLREFSEGVDEYLRKFPLSENREKMFSALVSGYLQISKLQELNSQLERMKDVPSIAYSQIANAVLQDSSVAPKANKSQRKTLALSAINLAIEQEKKYPVIYKPKYQTTTQWNDERRIILGSLYEQKGWILWESDSKEPAMESFKESLSLVGEEAPSSLYESLIRGFIESGDDSLAFLYATNAIIYSKSSENIENFHKTLYLKQNKDENKYILLLDNLKHQATELRLGKLKYELVKMPKVEGIIKNIDGRVLNTKDYNGKVIVIAFWSTWCGPCQSFLPAFKYLKKAYLDKDSVVFLPIVVWEKSEDKKQAVANFLQEYNAEMDIYIDEYDVLPKQAGVAGLPVTIFIGKNGEVQFFDEGFAGDNIFLQDAKDKIDFLLR